MFFSPLEYTFTKTELFYFLLMLESVLLMPVCPSVGDWLSNYSYIHRMKYSI